MVADNERVRGPGGRYPVWEAWPVNWSATWIGALTALAVALVIGLIAIAVGAHQLGTRFTSWHTFGVGALIFGICGAFFANVAGGWVAGKIAGILHAEPAILHGGIVWLLTLPMLIGLAALGAGNYFGVWGGGLAGTPVWVNTATATAAADPQAAIVARNEALGAVLALLIGLVGAVLGGWLASGEPMSLTHRRERDRHTTTTREYVTAGETVHVTPVSTQ
jgi:hypothetical protein